MLSKVELQEIIGLEEAGLNVVMSGNDGTIIYSTQGKNDECCCDKCEHFLLLPDPDPYDWFRDGDQKAICNKANAVMERHLERSSEWTNFKRPIYCPKNLCKLSDEEKKIAEQLLEKAKEDMI